MYCPECGKEIENTKGKCPNCSADISKYRIPVAANTTVATIKRKPLTLAGGMLMAGWVWLYTFKKDLWKFIFFISGEIAAIIGFVYGSIQGAINNDYQAQVPYFMLVFFLLLAFEILIRVWIFFEIFNRKEEFYIENGMFSKGGNNGNQK